MKKTLAALATATLLAVPFTSPTAEAAPRDKAVPLCIHEDGSTQLICVWHARKQGNGRGRSVLNIDYGRDQKVISHKTANRLTR